MPFRKDGTPTVLVLQHFFTTSSPEEDRAVFDRVTYSDGREDDKRLTEAGIMRALRNRGLVKEQIRADWEGTDEEFERLYEASLKDPVAVPVSPGPPTVET